MFDNLKESKTSYEPFKHVMQDTTSIFLGAKLSYAELLESEFLNFKVKAIINHYLLKEADKETTLESQMYYLEKGTFIFETLKQLKLRVKVQVLETKKGLFGKQRTEYHEKVLSLDELTNINLAKKKGMGMVITEIIISKLALMSFSV